MTCFYWDSERRYLSENQPSEKVTDGWLSVIGL